MHKRIRRSAFTLIELLVSIAIITILVGLAMVAIQRVRGAAQKMDCANRLKQLGLALHHYHDTYKSLPPGCSYRNGADPQPHMTWMTRLLPYLEQEALWQQAVAAFVEEKFFESPPHLELLGHFMPHFICPTDARSQRPWDAGPFRIAFTDYLGVGGTDLNKKDGVLYLDSKVRLADITDGISQTLAVGERPPTSNHAFGWWYAGWGQLKTGSADSVLGTRELRVDPMYNSCPPGPYEFRPEIKDDVCAAFHFWRFHPGGANFLLADGSVHFLGYSADPVLPALATRAGGETAALPD
jgi:prepilin-type N-terminal cleavage/methylation domain-containing protein/prepilin-type processing-associated H-X9-DG protein